MTGAGDGSRALLVLGFESTDARRSTQRSTRALELCRDARRRAGRAARRGGAAAPGAWRDGVPARALPARHARAPSGVLAETFETAITWERLPAFHEARHRAPSREALGAPGRVTLPLHARLPRRPGALLHRARAGAPRRGGRAVGARSSAPPSRRDPRRAAARSPTTTRSAATTGRWYDRQRPEPFAAALRARQGGGRPDRAAQPRGTARSRRQSQERRGARTSRRSPRRRRDHNARLPVPAAHGAR